jgi:hypothetical protein
MPLRFADPSPPLGWIQDFDLEAAYHARHTANGRVEPGHSTTFLEF